MARRSNRRMPGASADAIDDANTLSDLSELLAPVVAPPLSELLPSRELLDPPELIPDVVRDLTDLRRFDMERPRVARDAIGRGARLSENVRFSDPRQVMVCVRRQVRREVLFAKRKRGRGGGRRRRNEFSNVRC